MAVHTVCHVRWLVDRNFRHGIGMFFGNRRPLQHLQCPVVFPPGCRAALLCAGCVAQGFAFNALRLDEGHVHESAHWRDESSINAGGMLFTEEGV